MRAPPRQVPIQTAPARAWVPRRSAADTPKPSMSPATASGTLKSTGAERRRSDGGKRFRRTSTQRPSFSSGCETREWPADRRLRRLRAGPDPSRCVRATTRRAGSGSAAARCRSRGADLSRQDLIGGLKALRGFALTTCWYTSCTVGMYTPGALFDTGGAERDSCCPRTPTWLSATNGLRPASIS